MNLRKLNAVISLITTMLIFDHILFFIIYTFSDGRVSNIKAIPFVLAALTVIHAILSISMAFIGHKGAEKRKTKFYPQLNIKTEIQRFTGILMLFLLAPHIIGSFNGFQPFILHAITTPIFYAIVQLHVSVSLSKSFITLGIGTPRFIRIVDIVTSIVCFVLFILSTYCFFSFFI